MPGVFGPGWSSALDAGLDRDGRPASACACHDGAAITFRAGTAARPHGTPRRGAPTGTASAVAVELTEIADGYVVHLDHERRLRFDPSGALAGWEAGVGGRRSRPGDGRIVRLHEQYSGRSIAVAWDGELVSSLIASDGRTVGYTRDGRASWPRSSTVAGDLHYAWDGNLLLSVDRQRRRRRVRQRVRRATAGSIRQTSPFGRITEYTYQVPGATVISDDARRPAGDGARRAAAT